LTRDYEDDTALVFPNNTFDRQNFQYAFRLHSALVETTGGVDRGVRRARFMGVLRTQNRPAVLLEGGYLSNPREAQLIGQPEYRQKLAEAVAKALVVTNNFQGAAGILRQHLGGSVSLVRSSRSRSMRKHERDFP